MAKSKTKPKSKAKAAPKKAAAASKPKGDHVRMLPDKKLVISLSKEMDLSLKRSAELSGTLGQSMRDAKERGVNLPAFRLAKRFHRKAADDALGGSILWEDFQYYLMECLEFEKLIAPSMFPPAETRSSKPPKTNGKNKKDGLRQLEMADMPEVAQPEPTAADGAEKEAEASVH